MLVMLEMLEIELYPHYYTDLYIEGRMSLHYANSLSVYVVYIYK